MNRNTCLTALCLIAFSFVNFAEARTMEMLDFSTQAANAPNWSVDWGEVNNSATIAFSTTMSGDNNHWSRARIDFTNPAFEAEFGDTGSFLSLNRPDPVGSGGMTQADIHFENPLPEGSMMLVLDVDARNEVLALQAAGGISLGAPHMMESMSGTTSTFAAWDSSSTSLTTVSNGPNNDREAYYWNVSGLQDLHLEYTTHSGSAQIGFMVPEPSTATLCVMVSFLILLSGRRRIG